VPAPSLPEILGYDLRGRARAIQKYEASMSKFRALEQTATKRGRSSPVYVMPTLWGVIGVKQMHRSSVSLHLPAETRIPMLTYKILALYGARP